MLELNGFRCWVTTAENTSLLEAPTLTGEPDVVTCTVRLHGKKNYIIHWKSMSPVTAWCEVHTKSAAGKKITSKVAACEMDATKPETQIRSTHRNTATGRNLCVEKPGGSSKSMGVAWLEIRRVKSIPNQPLPRVGSSVVLDWLPSDNPTTGNPHATFIFNFELHEESPEGNVEQPSFQSITSSQGPLALNRPTRGNSIHGQGGKSPVSPNLQGPDGPTSIPIVSDSARGEFSSPDSSDPSSDSRDRRGSGLDTPEDMGGDEVIVSTSRKRNSTAVSQPNAQVVGQDGANKRPGLNATSGPSNLLLSGDDSLSESDDCNDSEAYTLKIARVDASILAYNEQLAVLNETVRYLQKKDTCARLKAQIRSTEAHCQQLSPNKSSVGASWTFPDDSDDEDDFATKNAKIDAHILAHGQKLEKLKEKEKYLEKKVKQKQLKAEIRAMKRRCQNLASNISRVEASTPAPSTPSK